MKNYLVKKLIELGKQKSSPMYKISATIVGGTFFAAILPFFLIKLGNFVGQFITIKWPPVVGQLIVWLAIPLGLFFLIWTITFQWKIGKAGPSHFISAQKLVISGPYKLCRNPMQLGGILYYLGVGTFFASPTVGIFCALVNYILGKTYHKLVEEKELEALFGDEYRKYKKETPFLIPKLWKK
ncbi:isoprenylcysteine carboxylmethyltransferase family protein [bacterium]|nr:isoprenylcysteine carboxylmethyltransferase family protein [bacterium]